MKKSIFIIFAILLSTNILFSQKITPPSKGKSKVYFARPSGYGGFINFKLFDSEKYLGKINGEYYFEYECDPGAHSFWALSEGMSMVYAELEEGKVYFINVEAITGLIKADVKLIPLDKKHKKFERDKKLIFNYINKYPRKIMDPEKLKKEEIKLEEKINEGIRYITILNKHNRRPVITPDMYIEITE
jgi:hypothetical protein